MRLLLNTIIAFVLVLGLVVVGYYFIKKPGYKERGESYSLPMAARDLVRDITGTGPSDDDEEDGPIAIDPVSGGPAPIRRLPVPTRDLWVNGMAAYADGRFEEALPLLEKALDEKQAPNGIKASEEVEVVRLCCRLLDGLPSGTSLDGPDIALVTSPGGDTFLAELVSESSDRITFRHKTMTFAVPRNRLKSSQLARTHEEKLRLAREEYRRRLADLESTSPRRAGDYLALARFARQWGLGDKVGYCIRQGITASGEGIEKDLYERWRASGTSQAQAEDIKKLLRHFYPRGDFTRHAWQVSSHGPFAGGPRDDGSPDVDRPSGIGGTSRRSPRHSDPEVNAILDQADEHRKQGDHHFKNTLPGMKDAAEHRRKALAAYTKALELYNEAEELHGVTFLERTITELTKRRYGLLKDTTIR